MRLVASAAKGAGPLGNRLGPTVPVPGTYRVKARHPMHFCYLACEGERKLLRELREGTWEPYPNLEDIGRICDH